MNAIAFDAKAHWGYSVEQLERWKADLTTQRDTIASWPTFAAERAGQLVGFAQIDPRSVPWELVSLFVAPSCMRQGIGAMLLQGAMLAARQAGVDVLHIDADPHALVFYQSFGAQEVSVTPAPIAGQPARVRPQLRLPTGRTRSAGSGG